MSLPVARRFLVAAVAAIGLAACGGDGPDGSAAPASTTTTAAVPQDSSTSTSAGGASPRPTEPPTPAEDGDDTGRSELEDGRHFGYWRSFEIGDTVATGEFDLAYFLSGDEAEKAAAAKGDEVTNDYYIVNDNPRLRTLFARGDTKVVVLVGDGAKTTTSNVADFAVERNRDAGFWVTIEDGIVTSIEEQYQP